MTSASKFQLRPHHVQALSFLQRNPGDEIGAINSEEQLAAAFVYSELLREGLITGTLRPGGGGVRLTRQGEFAIAEFGVSQ
jgi:hypothetical protein